MPSQTKLISSYSFQQVLNLELKCNGINSIFYIVKGRSYRNGPKKSNTRIFL